MVISYSYGIWKKCTILACIKHNGTGLGLIHQRSTSVEKQCVHILDYDCSIYILLHKKENVQSLVKASIEELIAKIVQLKLLMKEIITTITLPKQNSLNQLRWQLIKRLRIRFKLKQKKKCKQFFKLQSSSAIPHKFQ